MFQKCLGLVAVILLWGCAGAKIKNENVKLEAGALTKTDKIFVETISADHATFTGDKAEDSKRIAEEKTLIKELFAPEIIAQLKKKGFQASRPEKGQKGITLTGNISLFEHGSAASRMFVGMGAGSSNLHMNVKLQKEGKTISDFDVIATSGGRGGLSAVSSFLKAHIEDGAEKTAEYLDKNAK